MLVLTRKLGESITIDDGKIVIKILRVKGQQVRVGVQAPDDVIINREEVQEMIDESKTKKPS